MLIKEILFHKGNDVHCIGPDESLADVVTKMVQCNCGALVVMNGESLVGIISERDILRSADEHNGSMGHVIVRDRMTTNVITSDPLANIGEVMGMMTERRIRHLPILDDDQLVGLVSIGDIVKAQHQELSAENHQLKQYIQS